MNIDLVVQIWPTHPRRLEYFRRTLDSLSFLRATGHTLTCCVSSESEKPVGYGCRWCGDELAEECRRRGLPLSFRDGPADLPGHLNDIFGGCRSDLLFFLQDDYALNRPLNLQVGADLLLRRNDLAGFRYWAHTEYAKEFQGEFLQVRNAGTYSYGDNPALWHRRFFEQLGPFSDGGQYLSHESVMSRRLAKSPLIVLAMPEVKADPNYWFSHIGDITSVPNDNRWSGQTAARIADLKLFQPHENP